MKKKYLLFLLFNAVLFAPGGCRTSNVVSSASQPAEIDAFYVRRIAVVPFDNLTGLPNDAGRKITNTLVADVYSRNAFELLNSGELEGFLTDERIRYSSDFTMQKTQKLLSKYNVHAVLLGSINEYSYASAGTEQLPVISISARMLDTRTAKIIWAYNVTAEARETAFGLGSIRSLANLTELAINDIVDSLIAAKSETALSGSQGADAVQTDRSTPENPNVQSSIIIIDESEKNYTREKSKEYWYKIVKDYKK
ncbi:MAG: hypothetical protein HZA48_10305 [Planctomycetes bacterium]|nr:hypothetical protein [Planctomycetota bacterium]